jgi:hypothetical protein
LINKGILVRILSSRGIAVRNLRFRRALAYKINPKVALVYSLSLIKWIGYKARDLIKFKGGKGSTSSDLFLDLLPIPFYWVLLTYSIIERPGNSDLSVSDNLYALVA